MVKPLIALLVLTTAAVFFSQELVSLLNALIYLHTMITHALDIAFSKGNIGVLIQSVVALLVIPLLAGLLVAGLHWLFKRNSPSHTMSIIWVVWLVMVVAVTLHPVLRVNAHAGSHHKLNVAMNSA